MPDLSRGHSAITRGKGKIMNVGFIGLGRMGVGMATNLSKAGHRLTAYNRTQANAEKP